MTLTTDDMHKNFEELLRDSRAEKTDVTFTDIERAFLEIMDSLNGPHILFTYVNSEGDRVRRQEPVSHKLIQDAIPLHVVLDHIKEVYKDVEWTLHLPWQIKLLDGKYGILGVKAHVTHEKTNPSARTGLCQKGNSIFSDDGTALRHGKVVIRDCSVMLEDDKIIISPAPTDDIVIPAAVVEQTKTLVRELFGTNR